MNNAIHVSAIWDENAHVWVVQSDDVPGLITEAATLELLVLKLETMIPELLELNGVPFEQRESVPLRISSERMISLLPMNRS
ncbi:MAG: DUF1902 domain-containing protein [Magnetococcus sp. DMHC-1]|nr:DUF1902 domain-containing protein [Magnetococcales bacterium]MBF0155210.1 DUF1902 domain-containing protein [Magnetococcales bacterium]